MRVDAKANKHKPKSFLQTCEEIWHAVVEDHPQDAMQEQLELKARNIGTREKVPHQMSSMAKMFGLSPQLLLKDDTRARRLMRKCDGCKMAGHCFVTRRGKPDKDAHISPQSCPNFLEYQDMARKIGSRTAIKNKLV